jgi:hypothetical protein
VQTDRSTQQTPFVALYDDGRQRDDLLFQLKMGILFDAKREIKSLYCCI